MSDPNNLKNIILTLFFWLKYLSNRWLIIFFISISGGLIGYVINLYKKPKYTSTCTFILEGGNSSNQGIGIQAMAPLMSGSLNPSIGSQTATGELSLFQSNNYAALYKSRKILVRSLLTKVKINGVQMSLINYYMKINNFKWGNNVNFDGEKFNKDEFFTSQQNEVVNNVISDLKNNISVQYSDVGAPVLSIKVISEDSIFAKNLSEIILDEVNNYYLEVKSRKAIENISFYKKRSDSLRVALYSAMLGVAIAQENIPNLNSALQTVKLPPQKKQIEVGFLQSLYSASTNDLEFARNEVRRIQPYILVLDSPTYPLSSNRSNPNLGLIIGFVVSFVLVCLLLVVIKLFKDLLK